MAVQVENRLISRKRYAQSNAPSCTDLMKKGFFDQLREFPIQPDLFGDGIIVLARKVPEALGLERRFLEDVESVPYGILHHRGLKGLVVKRIESAYYNIEEESLRKELSEDLLMQVGFADLNVRDTLLKRSRLVPQHLEPIDIIKRFVKDEFKYNPILSKNAQEDITLPAGTVVFDFADYKNEEHCEVTRFFHGTDLYSAVDIMKNGIELNYGRHKHDFSDGGGFYLTTSFEHAKAWARSQTRKPAVLELNIYLEKAFTLALDVSTKEGRSAWDRVVREHRSGRTSKQLRQELEKYDCIAGPISVPRCPGSKDRVPECGSYQLCVVKRSFADEIVHHAKYALYTENEEQE